MYKPIQGKGPFEIVIYDFFVPTRVFVVVVGVVDEGFMICFLIKFGETIGNENLNSLTHFLELKERRRGRVDQTKRICV